MNNLKRVLFYGFISIFTAFAVCGADRNDNPCPDASSKLRSDMAYILGNANDYEFGKEGFNIVLEKSFDLYFLAAEYGDEEAQNKVAFFYKRYGTEQQQRKALEWLRKAREKGLRAKKYNLVFSKEHEKWVEMDGGKLLDAFQKKAASNGGAQYRLYQCYHKGLFGIKKDKDEAIKWLGLAAKSAFEPAINYSCAVCKRVTDKRCGYCLKLFYCGRECQQGHWSVHKRHCNIPSNVNHMTSSQMEMLYALCKKAAELDDPRAQFALYQKHKKDSKQQALYWLKRAADLGLEDALWCLGRHYTLGDGVEQDGKEGFKCWLKAADKGHPEAQYHVGQAYLYRKRIIEKNPIQAVKWFTEASKQGWPEAQLQLGVCYHEGIGIQNDSERAKYWYEQVINNSAANSEEISRAKTYLEALLLANKQ